MLFKLFKPKTAGIKPEKKGSGQKTPPEKTTVPAIPLPAQKHQEDLKRLHDAERSKAERRQNEAKALSKLIRTVDPYDEASGVIPNPFRDSPD
ncbi:MAG: hypothetical protein PHG63_00335 [Candidatus Dojkabacteria bacterium]|nr:hypothetical protein [Candidatus Dojkabacteria bacterium]